MRLGTQHAVNLTINWRTLHPMHLTRHYFPVHLVTHQTVSASPQGIHPCLQGLNTMLHPEDQFTTSTTTKVQLLLYICLFMIVKPF